jgi:hypothetical protein
MNVVKYMTNNQTITLVTLAFFVCIGALGILSSEQGVCTSKGHGLFDYTSTHLLGNDCDSVWMFVVIMVLAVVIQIMRNIIWIKSSQATRQAMQEDKGHRQKITIVMYTILSTMLYIISILVILGGNLWVMLAVLVGNVWGVLISVGEQEADKERLATAILHLKCKWDVLSIKKALSADESKELKELVDIRDWMKEFLNVRPSNPPNTPFQGSQALKFRI